MYLVSLITLVMIVVAAVGLINLGLKQWVFTKADSDFYYIPRVECLAEDESCDPKSIDQEELQRQEDQRSAQKQRDAAQDIAMLLVATPVFVFHFRLARKEV